MSNPNALFLLADHIKLSLLERKRAQALNLQSDSQDGHLSRSLDQFRDGLEALQQEQKRLEEAGDDAKAATIADSLPGLQKQFDDLTSQFHGFSEPSTNATLTHPNDPSLAADFAHASNTSTSPPLPSSSSLHPPAKKSLRNGGTSTPTGSKTVRFQDNTTAAQDDDAAAAAAQLFNQPYRDDPDGPEGYRDHAEGLADNVQVHAYHDRILREQDDQLDRLGESISRQRELSMQIGDELDDQVAMLEDQEALVDRHASRLDRARRQVGKVARSAGESKQMIAIIVLIVILILLIAVLK
ncbi:snare domain-containing protein [Diaporthe amygdali]|uniref:snare domain-containing protein n=1 Tax=Phomopsis amygdali TaxID=1214568 RepID=UPI0022FF01B7|nr:snare domain-containing protein [Diaporthe amygdali]KAJ0124733.1 snare domain-containing protein [Diaporthe amygdali]